MLIYWEEALILWRRNIEALVVASKETGLEVNTDNTKYTVMSRNKSAERSHSLKTDNRFFERMEEFRYLGTNFYVMWKHFGLCTADNYRYF